MEPLAADDPGQVGGFSLRGRLGQGGMGRVFLGTSPSGKAAAVKIVHPELARQAEFRRRFRAEVAVARTVSGAFTAPVMAAGPDDEPPWIATLYVAGPNLEESIAENGPLPEEAVWALAAGLVEALQHIHANDVLHRDLKPSNVLLAMDGPRLIDFGIARALHGTALTATGTVLGTPGFMSPEQVEGQEIGPACDVFALGAVIAFAASGNAPFGAGPSLAILHRITAGEPRLDPLRGPVRDLVAACLAKNPADRPTLGRLIERITPHWNPPDGVPGSSPWPPAVTALIRRHIAATATVLHPPAGQSPGPEPAAPDGPAGVRRPGPATSRQSTRRMDLFGGPGDGARPGRAERPKAAVRRTAKEAAERSRTLGRDHPETLAARYAYALALGNAGDYEKERRMLQTVVEDRARVLGPDDRETLEARQAYAYSLVGAGDFAEAARLSREVAEDRERVLGPDDPDTLDSRSAYAVFLGEAGNRKEAARLLHKAAEQQARVLGEDHLGTFTSRFMHAHNLGEAGDHEAAARWYHELAEAMAGEAARAGEPENEETLFVRSLYAHHLGESGNHEEAVRLLRDIAERQARILGKGHPDTLRTRYRHACHLGETGDHEEAARLLHNVARRQSWVFGPDDPETLASRHERAHHVGEAGDRERAEELFREVTEDRARVLGPDHPDTLASRHELAHCLGDRNEFGEAARLSRDVARDRARVLGPDDPDTLDARYQHAGYLALAGDHREAAHAFHELSEDMARVVGRDHSDALHARYEYAVCLGEAGNPTEAARLLRKLAREQARVLGPDHPDTVESREAQARFRGEA